MSCGSLPAIENGKKIGSGDNTVGFTVRFECEPCYQLEGSSNRACQANGSWSGTDTACNREYS